MATFEAEPDNGFLLSELCERVYRGINQVEKKHRVAVARAAYKIPWLAQMKRATLGGELVFYRPASVMSYGMARLKTDNFAGYERNTDPRFSWRQPKSENDLRASLLPGGDHHKYIVEGAPWHRFAATEHARLIGDIATYERLEREQKAKLDETAEDLRAAFARMPQRPRRPQRPPIIGYRLVIEYSDDTTQTQDFKCRRAANRVRRALDDDDTVSVAWVERVYGAPGTVQPPSAVEQINDRRTASISQLA
jgi:hypothetical protein